MAIDGTFTEEICISLVHGHSFYRLSPLSSFSHRQYLCEDQVPNFFRPVPPAIPVAKISEHIQVIRVYMCTSISASQWGSPTASRRALLVHGLTMSSQSWEGVAKLLAAEGFFVVAPNLLGHAWRRGTDYRMSTLAEDLRPYFVMDASYDVIIGHSLGGAVTLSLLPFLPNTKETTVILLDPAIELTEESADMYENRFLNEIANVRTADDHMTENPAWSRSDSVLRALGVSMCDRTVVEGIFEHNRPWSFSGLFKNIPLHVKITVLASDPKLGAVCHLEHVPCDVARLHAKLCIGISHWIHYESLDVIMNEIPLRRAKL